MLNAIATVCKFNATDQGLYKISPSLRASFFVNLTKKLGEKDLLLAVSLMENCADAEQLSLRFFL